MAPKKEISLNDIHLSKGISELEDDIEAVWEPPEIFDDVLKDNIWLIYGKKGSGKSHLIDFLRFQKKRETGKECVFTIRPRQNRLFPLIMDAINDVVHEDERVVTENIAIALEFVVVTLLMRELIEISGFLLPSSNKEIIYNFLCNNDLIEGSIIRKSIRFLSKLTGGEFKLISNLANLLNDEKGSKEFILAKKALWEILDKENNKLIVCIDDIDEIGFSFSKVDRLFVNALLVLMWRLNCEFCSQKIPIRILLTSPSELFFHSSLWGDDWVDTKSRCLRWLHHDVIQKIVNKRIAKELNIKKSRPLTEYDVYSDNTESTWNRLFPTTIENKCGRKELAITYILRHTFYTPRQVLEICDAILSSLGDRGYTTTTIKNIDEKEWNKIFQQQIEEYTYNIISSFLKLYNRIYDGIEDVFYSFSSRPCIWSKAAIIDFVSRRNLKITRKENGKIYSGETLINKLQHLGFLGLANRNILSPIGAMSFKLRFSFLERLPSSRPWEMAVIAPVFFDPYGIRVMGDTVIVPHEDMKMANNTWDEVMRYSVP